MEVPCGQPGAWSAVRIFSGPFKSDCSVLLRTYFFSPDDWIAGGTQLLLPKVFCTSSVVEQNELGEIAI